jgi:hypothetical protein
MAIVATVLTLDVGKPTERKTIALQNKASGDSVEVIRFYSRADLTLMEKPLAILAQVGRVAEGAAAIINARITLGALTVEAWDAIVGDTGIEGAFSPLIDGYLSYSRVETVLGTEPNPDWVDADPDNPAAPIDEPTTP